MKRRVYLDVAAAAPVTETARKAFTKALRAYGNPSAMHGEGREAKGILEAARSEIARLSGAKASGVTFTSGATEANALALLGYTKRLIEEGRTPESVALFYHPGAHASTVKAMRALARQGFDTRPVPTAAGAIDLAALARELSPKTALITLEAISPETGMRLDTRGVRRLLDTYQEEGNPKILLHVDASQVPFVESIERTRLGADLMTLDAQKIGGVRGIGALIRGSGIQLAPLIQGGGQEGGLRSGTESPALAHAFASALHEAFKRHEAFSKSAKRMRERLIAAVTAEVSGVRVLGGTQCAPHILTFSLPHRDTDYLVALLDHAGFAVSTKSACEADPSLPARMAFEETGDEVLAASTLRISWGPDTSGRDIESVIPALLKAVRFLDQGPA